MSQICRVGIFWQIPAHKIDNSGYLIKDESRCHNYLGLSQHDPCEKTPILKGIPTFDVLTIAPQNIDSFNFLCYFLAEKVFDQRVRSFNSLFLCRSYFTGLIDQLWDNPNQINIKIYISRKAQ